MTSNAQMAASSTKNPISMMAAMMSTPEWITSAAPESHTERNYTDPAAFSGVYAGTGLVFLGREGGIAVDLIEAGCISIDLSPVRVVQEEIFSAVCDQRE